MSTDTAGHSAPAAGKVAEHAGRGPLTTDELAAVIGRDIPAGAYVNLGIGQPTKIADYLPVDADGNQSVILHTENGMLGMGPTATGDDIDPDLTNAGKAPVTELPGAAYFHHADSFAMMRGGHLDVCVLGAYQVSATGDLANWHTGKPDDIPAVGGAMDLAIGAKDVYVMMTLFTKQGEAKLVAECSYPLTGVGCVSRVYTDYAVFDLQPDGVHVLATYGITLAGLRDRVGVKLLG
jgi:3-oxoadipate CoA-transferase, beta subunit